MLLFHTLGNSVRKCLASPYALNQRVKNPNRILRGNTLPVTGKSPAQISDLLVLFCFLIKNNYFQSTGGFLLYICCCSNLYYRKENSATHTQCLVGSPRTQPACQ
jgi:hypothetical protein